MHDYTSTDTENMYWVTLIFSTLNFTRGKNVTETYTGRRSDAMKYVPLCTRSGSFGKIRKKRISPGIFPCLGSLFHTII